MLLVRFQRSRVESYEVHEHNVLWLLHLSVVHVDNYVFVLQFLLLMFFFRVNAVAVDFF